MWYFAPDYPIRNITGVHFTMCFCNYRNILHSYCCVFDGPCTLSLELAMKIIIFIAI